METKAPVDADRMASGEGAAKGNRGIMRRVYGYVEEDSLFPFGFYEVEAGRTGSEGEYPERMAQNGADAQAADRAVRLRRRVGRAERTLICGGTHG